MIDLRSDTFTVPTDDMRQVIATAKVGDDVFGEDPTVNELEEYSAQLLGKEAALFVTSGTMGNQISLAVLTKPGDEAIVEADAHIFYYETGAPAIISRVQLRCIPSERGMPEEEKIISAVRSSEYWFPRTTLICLENTHNRHGGAIIKLDYIKRIAEIARKHGLFMHCDGARLWHACAATGISPKEYAAPFDTVSVCFSKALGAPVGSCIVSTKENIVKARRWRKILGGGMRQAGIIAAGGLFALKNNLQLLKKDHENARIFAEILNESEFFFVNLERVETNIVIFKHSERIEPKRLEDECRKRGVLIIPLGNNFVRTVFYFQITTEQAINAANIIKEAGESIKNYQLSIINELRS